MKKILISLLCVMMVACMMPVMAFAADESGSTSTAAEIIDGKITLENDEARTLTGSLTNPITVEGTGKLHLKDLTIETAGDALTVAGNGITLIIEGSVSIISTDGSAITGEVIDISGTGTLKATAGDANGAFGIGGINTKTININGITIEEVIGGFDGEKGTDTKYYKDAPNGGAAIGSGYNGAIITLDNVTIEKAIGGSKSAGIGAMFHTGVTININNCIINYVEGGVTAAAIGSSRVSSGASESGTTINIIDSEIKNAVGGAFAAGIGSGYDTHTQSKQPLCTININGAEIVATGGKYAAGIGTGYHNAALDGEIVNSNIEAKAGETFCKHEYTKAQDIGFGVSNPAKEATQTQSSITYKDEIISIPFGAQIGEKKYASLRHASDNSAPGETIILLMDDNTSVNLKEGVILYKNGYTAENVTGVFPSIEAIAYVQDDGSKSWISIEIDNPTSSNNVKLKLYKGSDLLTTSTLKEGIAVPILTGKIGIMDTSSSWTWDAWTPKDDVKPDKMIVYIDNMEVGEATVGYKVIGMTEVEPLTDELWAGVTGTEAPAPVIPEPDPIIPDSTPIYYPIITIEKPVIESAENATVTLGILGDTATIAVAEGYEIADVTVNGVSKGAVTSLSGLKTGDKIVVITEAIVVEPEVPEKSGVELAQEKLDGSELVARSKATKSPKGKDAILITWYDKADDEFDFDGVEIYRSTKKGSGFKKIYTSKSDKYYNTSIKEGVKYYYKVRGFVTVDGEKIYTDWSLKAIRTAK